VSRYLTLNTKSEPLFKNLNSAATRNIRMGQTVAKILVSQYLNFVLTGLTLFLGTKSDQNDRLFEFPTNFILHLK